MASPIALKTVSGGRRQEILAPKLLLARGPWVPRLPFWEACSKRLPAAGLAMQPQVLRLGGKEPSGGGAFCQGGAVKIALQVVHFAGFQKLAMLVGFRTLTGDVHAQGMAQIGNGTDDGAGFLGFRQL